MSVHRLTAVAAGAALALGAGTAVAADPDPTYPTGTFTVTQPGRLGGYGGCYDTLYATGTITVASLVDDNTPSDRIRLRLDLPGVWEVTPLGAPQGETKGIQGWDLLFTAPGTYAPTVTITDQDAHQTTMTLPPMTVTADTTAPVGVRVTSPAAKQRAKVSAWRVLRGTATDPESGIFGVEAEVLQRRAGTWYAYDGRARKWRKGNKSETWTRNHRRPSMDTQRIYGQRWVMPSIAGLTKGLLVVRAKAMHNGSCLQTAAPQVRVRLTKR